MPETVNIPLSVLNRIPNVAGLEDISFEIPTRQDISEEIDAQTADRDEFFEEARRAIEEGELDLGTDEIAEQTARQIEDNIEDVDISIDGFFGPTEGDIAQIEELFSDDVSDISDITDRPESGFFDGDEIPIATPVESISDEAAGLSTPALEAAVAGNLPDSDVTPAAAAAELRRRGQQEGFDPSEDLSDEFQQRIEQGRLPSGVPEDQFAFVGSATAPSPDIRGIGDTDNPFEETIENVEDITNGTILEAIGEVAGIVEGIAELSVEEGSQLLTDPAGFFEDIFKFVFPDLNGVSFFDEPLEWVLNLGIELSEIVVSEQSRNNLTDALNGFARPADRGGS